MGVDSFVYRTVQRCLVWNRRFFAPTDAARRQDHVLLCLFALAARAQLARHGSIEGAQVADIPMPGSLGTCQRGLPAAARVVCREHGDEDRVDARR
jgi:hypothetical protein